MSTALAYHDATKYRPDTIGQQPPIDWERQPLPFKDYTCAEPVELAAWLPFDPNPFTGAPRTAEALETPLALNRAALSRLLFCAYGITGMIAGERPIYLRAAPSAGGLYPAELYVVSLGNDFLPAGLYGYDPRHHHLVPLAPGPELHAAVVTACYGNAAVAASPLLLVTSAVFWRSAWRYGERAYRRVLLDTGHLLGNAALATSALGLRCHLTTAFCDEQLNRVLRVESDDEAALAVLAINLPGPGERPAWSGLPSPVGGTDEVGLIGLHHASSLPAQRPALIARGEQQADAVESGFGARAGEPLAAEHLHSRLSTDLIGAILHRRSTRRFVRGSIQREQMERILACGSAPEAAGLGEQPMIERDLLRTFVAVAAVEGLEPGVYYYAPHSRELRLVRAGLRRDSLQFICLGQELGRDAAFAVFHTADLARAVRRHGDRVYRVAHLEAGLVGERINLGALAEGLGVSGIGGFFDDHAAQLLGLPVEQAIVYITVIGMAADRDGR
jgi:SagB-type dehydrogenase family enzyme